MATGKDYKPDPVKEARWRLARREDLADVMGIVLSVPMHGQDPDGVWRFGLRTDQGWADEGMTAQFDYEVQTLFSIAAEGLVERGALARTRPGSFTSHPYEIGPAAQGWPMQFVEFVQQARPLLEDGATLLAWGYFLKDVIRKLWEWGSAMDREASKYPQSRPVTYDGRSSVPSASFTRPAIVALCYVDLVDHYPVTEAVTLETFPRSKFGYVSQDHPGGSESYLIRFTVQRMSFYYHVLGSGQVLEHFKTNGPALSLLPIRDITGVENRSYIEAGESDKFILRGITEHSSIPFLGK